MERAQEEEPQRQGEAEHDAAAQGARKIREASDAFAKKVEDFRELFQKLAPFSVKGKITTDAIEPAYAALDHFHHGKKDREYVFGSLNDVVAESAELNEKQDLFELIVTDYVALRKSSEDLTNLKLLWDMISSVIYTFTSCRTTLWDKIDVDFLVEETKKLQKETKQLPKGCAQYDVFRTLGDQVKALLTSLPLVAELRHPAMRERHWKLLQQVTGKKFTMDEKFSLGDLLALELHTCADNVSEIVERAQKELVIEKQLVKIEKDWAGLHLDFVPFNPDSDVVNIVVDDLIVEALENDNLLLQNLGSNKYVQGTKFQEIVDEWQKKLGTVDGVLSVWRT